MELTKEQKELILRSNGWTTLWSESNWVKKEWIENRPGRHGPSNIDWAGSSLDNAFKQYLRESTEAKIKEESRKMYNEHLERVKKQKDNNTTQKPIGKCSECGREYYPVEWYSCMNDKCPLQRRITF